MKCGDFLEALHGEDSFADCARHYNQCSDCRERYKSDFALESALRGINNECRNIDISASVRREIRDKQIRKRELSTAKIIIWGAIILASVYLAVSMIPIMADWSASAISGLNKARSSISSLMAGTAGIQEKTDKIFSMGYNGEVFGALLVICGLSMVFLFIQSKEFLVRLRMRLNR